MPARLTALGHAQLAETLAMYDAADDKPRDVERALVKHYLALMEQRHPGKSVELRVPPYAAVQCVPGVRHTRGTPPAVVEVDATVFIALARGHRSFSDARESGELSASGERSDLSDFFPL